MTTRVLLVLVLLAAEAAVVFGTLAVLLEDLPATPFWISLTAALACCIGLALVWWDGRQRGKGTADRLAGLQDIVRPN